MVQRTEVKHRGRLSRAVAIIGRRLRETRQQAGMSQDEVARRAALSVDTYRSLEGAADDTAHVNPTLDTVLRAMWALGIEVSDLVTHPDWSP